MNLKEWAAATGISYATARRRYESGTLPVPAYRLGRLIMVGEPLTGATKDVGQTAVYACVSSADREADLDRQVARITMWATGRRLAVDRVVTEVGSLNGHRVKFLALLRDASVSTIVVEHRDRFARFGAGYVEAALSAQGRRLLVVDPSEVDDDLVGDVTEILTSLCARLYGRRAGADRVRRAIEVVTEGSV
ncbi:IS607 family transposase [Micromonospora coxensis]|uniref:IS607 family transposase n=1 Tax=Micromonospora coxensis TaxID=356852 RepID=UPI0034315E7E